MNSNQEDPKITIDVGGKIFSTNLSTFMRYPKSLLATMFRQDQKLKPSQYDIPFFDRDPRLFKKIMEIYRHGTVIGEIDEILQKEMDYWGLEWEAHYTDEQKKEDNMQKSPFEILTRTFTNHFNVSQNWQRECVLDLSDFSTEQDEDEYVTLIKGPAYVIIEEIIICHLNLAKIDKNLDFYFGLAPDEPDDPSFLYVSYCLYKDKQIEKIPSAWQETFQSLVHVKASNLSQQGILFYRRQKDVKQPVPRDKISAEYTPPYSGITRSKLPKSKWKPCVTVVSGCLNKGDLVIEVRYSVFDKLEDDIDFYNDKENYKYFY